MDKEEARALIALRELTAKQEEQIRELEVSHSYMYQSQPFYYDEWQKMKKKYDEAHELVHRVHFSGFSIRIHGVPLCQDIEKFLGLAPEEVCETHGQENCDSESCS